jgi:hypothetical protein
MIKGESQEHPINILWHLVMIDNPPGLLPMRQDVPISIIGFLC